MNNKIGREKIEEKTGLESRIDSGKKVLKKLEVLTIGTFVASIVPMTLYPEFFQENRAITLGLFSYLLFVGVPVAMVNIRVHNYEERTYKTQRNNEVY